MTPSRTRSLGPLLRALGACAVLGTLAAVARAEWHALPDVLAARGLFVVPGSLHWIDPPGLAARRALVLAHAAHEPSDLFVVTARTGSGDRVVSVRDVSNLTRSRDADETDLVVSGAYGAFASRVGGAIVAFSVVDTRGDPTVTASDVGSRVRGVVTRVQQTGRVRGYGLDRFDLVHPAHTAQLRLAGGVLDALLDGAHARVNVARLAMLDGASLVRERPRRDAVSPGWVTWAVDTARAVSWIGPGPIAWAEGVAFRAEHVVSRARVATLGDHSQADVAEDLADVLNVHATSDVEGPVRAWPPEPMRGTVQPALEHEGEWSPLGADDDPFVRRNPGAPPGMYVSFVRTDAERADSRVYIVVWDPRQIELHVTPGAEEPMGATGETGTGAIPRDEHTMARVVAGFNGAFQALHGEYGVYGEGIVLLPAKPYAATVALMADGSTGFGTWPGAQTEIPDDVVEFRQNLTPLIDNGVFNPWHRNFWGGVLGTATNAQGDQRTTRTAICMTGEGYVAYAWGDKVAPDTLAAALRSARCTYALHLDMNGANTGFELLRAGPQGSLPALGRAFATGFEGGGAITGMPGMEYRTRRLVRRMSEPLGRYIHRDTRDFFYLLLRPVLPGPPIASGVRAPQPGEGVWHVAGLSELAFPWPMARTRVRPDPAQPERWVNLLRLDARRVAIAPLDAHGTVVARMMGGSLAAAGQLRIAMTQGIAGAQWSIGAVGDGIAGEALRAGMSAMRGAGIDANGFLVMAVADRAVPDLVNRALDLAGCGRERIALQAGALALPTGAGAAGETIAADAQPTLALVEREFVGARRLFPEVTPLPLNAWAPAQRRQVRYVYNAGHEGTMQVRILGRQQPVVLPIPGYPWGPGHARGDGGVAP